MTELWTLSRYRNINKYFWQELKGAEFYCGSPKGLNDPLDCQIEPLPSIDRALRNNGLSIERRAAVAQMRSEFAERDPTALGAGICCFSGDMGNQLMWSYYSSGHKGVCLRYEIPSNYFNDKYPIVDKGFYFVGGSPVEYHDDAFTNWLMQGDMDKPLAGQPTENGVAKLYSSKAKCWEHEYEFRVVTSEPGKLKFEPDFLKVVTFGMNTSSYHRKRIANAARRNNPSVVFLHPVRDGLTDFGLRYDEWAT